MTDHDHPSSQAEADAAFEQLLLRSASTDALPAAATREAWAKFARASAGVSLVGAAAAPGLGDMWRAARSASLKWLALGAIAGSALTAAFLSARSAPTGQKTAAPPETIAISPPAPALALTAARGHVEQPGSAMDAPLPSGAQRPIEASSQHPPLKRFAARPKSEQAPPGAQTSASSLAAEVAALDSVQKALGSGDFPRALRLVDDYHREFPRGQLTPDADALSIEAVEALGNRTELAIRARQFLRRYPKDPHAARIATLVEP